MLLNGSMLTRLVSEYNIGSILEEEKLNISRFDFSFLFWEDFKYKINTFILFDLYFCSFIFRGIFFLCVKMCYSSA